MKTSNFEVGVALGAAGAAEQRDEPIQRELATFHRHAISSKAEDLSGGDI